VHLPGIFLEVKGGWHVKLTASPPSVSKMSKKVWELQVWLLLYLFYRPGILLFWSVFALAWKGKNFAILGCLCLVVQHILYT
jgi:hypothetical protein